MDTVEKRNGDYAPLGNSEGTQLGKFDRPLPCFGCGIGWFSLLLGFVCPLMWYYATILYFGNYYHKDPRERAGLAASAIAALIFSIAVLITIAAFLLKYSFVNVPLVTTNTSPRPKQLHFDNRKANIKQQCLKRAHFPPWKKYKKRCCRPFGCSPAADHRLRRSYSLFLSSGTLLIFILATAIVFIFIIIPPLGSFTSHIFKPHLVKKSWDSLNLVLVLFAIVCGFLSRNSNESPRSYEDDNFSNAPRDYVSAETPRRWYVSADCTPYRSFNRLRSTNSYPDLRQESSWVSGDERWRFYDDTHVNGYHGLDRLLRPEADEKEMAIKIKNIAVDTFIASTEEFPLHRRSHSRGDHLLHLSRYHRRPQLSPQKLYPFAFKTATLSTTSAAAATTTTTFSSMRVLKTKPHIGGVISHKPHIPNKRETSKLEEKVIANNESQLNLIPPPPLPPPPFKVPVWKFRVQGDYVRVDSIGSSCSSSSDLDEVGDLLSNQTSPLNSPSTPNGGESTVPLFCPSPDVDTKADTFIARFRAGEIGEDELNEGEAGDREIQSRYFPSRNQRRTAVLS
ncbi:hypothetical protein L6164_021429 [Bauhinia variegata]|uniref:Uncharacterized protein n=1 Tax=Bauhinia variegata TaxID=167791 RepID=A0ACB9MZH8_BAUVA|nr:hypothetical protein L6164_021429 [Bauhinia variegata]